MVIFAKYNSLFVTTSQNVSKCSNGKQGQNRDECSKRILGCQFQRKAGHDTVYRGLFILYIGACLLKSAGCKSRAKPVQKAAIFIQEKYTSATSVALEWLGS
ncbi:hypothetical protein FKM82_022281 [Ascaphus truei]